MSEKQVAIETILKEFLSSRSILLDMLSLIDKAHNDKLPYCWDRNNPGEEIRQLLHTCLSIRTKYYGTVPKAIAVPSYRDLSAFINAYLNLLSRHIGRTSRDHQIIPGKELKATYSEAYMIGLKGFKVHTPWAIFIAEFSRKPGYARQNVLSLRDLEADMPRYDYYYLTPTKDLVDIILKTF